jgi:hypothetical protein
MSDGESTMEVDETSSRARLYSEVVETQPSQPRAALNAAGQGRALAGGAATADPVVALHQEVKEQTEK